MQTSSLTDIVEKKFLSLIENQEVLAFEQDKKLPVENYVKLANLYHFHKNFEKEQEILTRYTDSKFADNEVLMDIFDRIENISKTRHAMGEGTHIVSPSEKLLSDEPDDRLSLVKIESEDDIVEISSNTKVIHKNKNTQTALDGMTISILTVCAVYTGRLDTDEIVELSLTLFEYTEGNEKPFHSIGNYSGIRKTKAPVPEKVKSKFQIDANTYQRKPMNKAKVLAMFAKADYVISHNNPNIERKFLVTLFPEIKDCAWYSTQKDIPWRALGFDSIGLSGIIHSFGKRKPRSSLERAKAIAQLLQQNEPNTDTPFIERIHYMKPMKPIEWTKEMSARNKQLNKKDSKKGWYVCVLLLVVIASLAGAKYLNVF